MTPSEISGLVNDVTHLKTGWKTSEFWVTIGAALVSVLAVFGVHVSDASTTHFVVVGFDAISAVYVAVRSLLKSVHVGHAVSLAGLLHQLETEGKTVIQDVEEGKPITFGNPVGGPSAGN